MDEVFFKFGANHIPQKQGIGCDMKMLQCGWCNWIAHPFTSKQIKGLLQNSGVNDGLKPTWSSMLYQWWHVKWEAN